MARMFGPKQESDLIEGRTCGLCGRAWKAGDRSLLIPIGPADEDEAKRKAAGRPYNAEAREVCIHCCEATTREYAAAMMEILGN